MDLLTDAKCELGSFFNSIQIFNLFQIYKLVFVFPREKRITLMAFCCRDDERTLTTSC